MPLRIVERIKDKTRGWRVERFSEYRRLAVETTMTDCAIHGVDLQAFDQVLVGRRNGVVQARGAAFHGSVERSHRNLLLELRWSGIGVGREEAEQGKSDADNHKDHDNDYTTKKKTHWDSLGEKSQVYITFAAAA